MVPGWATHIFIGSPSDFGFVQGGCFFFATLLGQSTSDATLSVAKKQRLATRCVDEKHHVCYTFGRLSVGDRPVRTFWFTFGTRNAATDVQGNRRLTFQDQAQPANSFSEGAAAAYSIVIGFQALAFSPGWTIIR